MRQADHDAVSCIPPTQTTVTTTPISRQHSQPMPPAGKKDRSNAGTTAVSPRVALLRQLSLLLTLFVAWKVVLLAMIAISPGIGYDTSTTIASDDRSDSLLAALIIRLTRWDGIYFASNSASGYVYEQQWAFSWAVTRVSAFLANVLPLPDDLSPLLKHSFAASIMSSLSHAGTVLMLYLLVVTVLPSTYDKKQQVAFTAASLHIISPAGVFLVAPYSESIYALLSFAGMLAYVKAIESRSTDSPRSDALWTLSAGISWGVASMMRGNGLLNGIVLAWDMLDMTLAFLLGDRSLRQLVRMASTGLAGTAIAVGYAMPQYVAYMEYCLPASTRTWCDKTIPSIYSFVQDYYWNVGFLRYWTLSNLPLFALAMPMLLVLLITGYAALHHSRSLLMSLNGEERPSHRNDSAYQTRTLIYKHILERLAVPQLVLTVLAATSFHIQIINRISSGYPLWYIVLAIAVHDDSPRLACGHGRAEHYFPLRHIGGERTKYIIQGVVIYAVIQAGLYSSFLPPA